MALERKKAKIEKKVAKLEKLLKGFEKEKEKYKSRRVAKRLQTLGASS